MEQEVIPELSCPSFFVDLQRRSGNIKRLTQLHSAKACERATATAYKAVMKPKEGTILTVAKGASQKAAELAETTTEDLDTFISEVNQLCAGSS